MIGVVAAIGDQPSHRTGGLEEGPRDADIVDVTGRQQQDPRPPLTVGQRVELARFAAARLPERLEVGPPFPPPAERCALMCVLSIIATP